MLLEFDGTFLFALISFIIFVALMNLILYRPITKVIEERGKLLNDNKDIVEKSQKKAQEAKEFHENEILNAKVEASNILSDTKNSLKMVMESAIKTRKEEINKKLFENNEILLNEKNEAQNILKDEIEQYVKMAVLKILEEENIDIKIDKERLNGLLEARK